MGIVNYVSTTPRSSETKHFFMAVPRINYKNNWQADRTAKNDKFSAKFRLDRTTFPQRVH